MATDWADYFLARKSILLLYFQGNVSYKTPNISLASRRKTGAAPGQSPGSICDLFLYGSLTSPGTSVMDRKILRPSKLHCHPISEKLGRELDESLHLTKASDQVFE